MTMAKTLSDHLLNTLEELVPYDFEKFKFKLQNTNLEKDHSRIPRGHLQLARPVKLATLLITHYGEEYAVRLTLQILRGINQRFLAEELHRATSQDYSIPESGTDTSTWSSSRENKPKSLRESNGLEVDGQPQQSGDVVSSLQSTQHEMGRAAQKKCQSKRKDPKVPEDTQSKPSARVAGPNSKRSPGPTPMAGDKERRESGQLRRNASSAGRLQGLCSGALGRKESKKSELYLPSGKKRPKSLEIPISSGGGEPPNPEILLPQEETQQERNAHSESVAAPKGVVSMDGEGPAAQEGSRNPDCSVVLERRAFKNTLPNALSAGEKKCTASWEENGIGGPEAPGPLVKMTGSVCHKSSNPEVTSPSGKPEEESACHLCHTRGGDLHEDMCIHGACSSPTAPKDPQATGSHPSSCPQCQASLTKKGSGGLSSQPPPHCQHHKQVQLLFCEDHREAICLICRLSQEHRGHWVRPLQEAATEYREQIQKQLEHLKELRTSGEEQRRQGDKKTGNLLKQTETQKQKIRCHLEKLSCFLEQQEQLFVAWLEELHQTINRAWGNYDTQVSQDIHSLDELIGELEARKDQSEWELMQDIGVTLQRARAMTIPKPWTTPEDMKEKIHLLHKKSEFVEKNIQHFSEAIRSEMETFNVPELTAAQAHAASVILDPATAHPNLIFSDDMMSVRLGNKWDRLPDSPERFDSCIITLGSPNFISGRHYWEVEVGNKTAWILGVCRTSTNRKGSMTLSPENGYWVVMMMKRNEYQASTIPPTRLKIREPPKRVGIFLDYTARDISFYNVTARSHIYTFTGFSSSLPLQPIFSPGTHDGGKNMGPLTICPVGGQGPH
ncbi:pyrin-like [Dipodomys merriami]|uniref:pyrin-like n=1 Tax=Dipodomys merriami TaxID=94247 RepID=UPI0038558D9C